MKLIVEQNDNVNVLVEKTETGEKSYWIVGPYIQCEQANRNKRIYRKPIIEKQVTEFQKLIEAKRALGELNHPDTPQINLERASHLITELAWDGNDVIGRSKVLDTPCGKIAKALLDEGVKLGVSTRGIGSVKPVNDGLNEVQDDYVLATVDIVSDPSAHNAFVQGILESKEWVVENGNYKVIESIQKEIRRSSVKEIEEKAPALLERFLRTLH